LNPPGTFDAEEFVGLALWDNVGHFQHGMPFWEIDYQSVIQ
jgi:hypothetical protein